MFLKSFLKPNVILFAFIFIFKFHYGFSHEELKICPKGFKPTPNVNIIFEMPSKSKGFLPPNLNVNQVESFQNPQKSSIAHQAEKFGKEILIFNRPECLPSTEIQGPKKDFLGAGPIVNKGDFLAQEAVRSAEIQGPNGDIVTSLAQVPKGYTVSQGVACTSLIVNDKGLYDNYHFYIEYPKIEANVDRPNSEENGLPGPTNSKLMSLKYFTFIDGPPVIENYSSGCQNYAELDLKVNANSVSPSIFQRLLKSKINAEDVFVIWVGEEIDSSVRWIIKTEIKGVVVSSVKTNLSSDDLPSYSVRLRYNSIRETQAVIDQQLENHITTSVFNWNYNTQTHTF